LSGEVPEAILKMLLVITLKMLVVIIFKMLLVMKLDTPDLLDIVSDEVRVVKLFIPVDSAVSKKVVMIIEFIIKSLNFD